MEYAFEIHHIPGSTNAVADVLSRIGHNRDSGSGDIIDSSEVHNVNAVNVVPTATTCAVSEINNFNEEVKKAQASMSVDVAGGNVSYNKCGDGFVRDGEGRIVIPASARELVKYILHAAHGTPFSGHLGLQRTIDAIYSQGYVWSGIYDDVKEFIECCPACQKTRLRRHVEVEMKTTMVDQPFHTICIDTLGPLTEDTAHGYKYIIVLVDAFTRWVELYPSASTDAKSAADALIATIFARHGLPAVVRSDNGSQYANELIEKLLDVLKVKHHRVIPYHPQSNGIVERLNFEIMKHLRCLTCDLTLIGDWPAALPIIQFILNNTVHSALGVTPHAMLYGDHLTPVRDFPRVIMEGEEMSVLKKFPELLDIESGVSVHDYVALLKQRLLAIQAQARVVQEKEVKERVSKRATAAGEYTSFNIGDYVLMVPHQRTKIMPNHTGPFKIIGVITDQLYKLQDLFDPSRVLEVHVEMLRPFKLRDDIIESDLRRMAQLDHSEYMVERVIGHKGNSKRTVKFLIKWEGYDDDHNTWEPWNHVNGNVLVDQYIAAHPELAPLMKG